MSPRPRTLLPLPDDEPDDAMLVAFAKISADLKKGARELTPSQARYAVDTYYQVQQFRIEAANQVRAATAHSEPIAFLTWVANLTSRMEGTIKTALNEYTETLVPARWSKTIPGIGPVLSAGLSAHIDIRRAPTVGHIYRYAGLDPTTVWLGADAAATVVDQLWVTARSAEENMAAIATHLNRQVVSLMRLARTKEGAITKQSTITAVSKRPWNATLKLLCWKIGESFVKVQSNAKDIYGHVYQERKALEIQRNLAGVNAEAAARILREKKFLRDTVARTAYRAGIFPDGHIHARAKRYAVKLFLAHYHHVAYEVEYQSPPPKPYIIEHGGHTHFIKPPHWYNGQIDLR